MTESLRNGVSTVSTLEEIMLSTRGGHHYLNGGLYQDGSFSKLLNPSSSILTPDNLYIKISLTSWDTRLKLILEKCWATPNSNPSNPLQYTFINNFCPDDYEYNIQKSIFIYNNGASKSSSFSLRSFTWQGEAESIIYFHCLASICDQQTSSCIPQCNNRKRRGARTFKQKRQTLIQTQKISVGPIYINTK